MDASSYNFASLSMESSTDLPEMELENPTEDSVFVFNGTGSSFRKFVTGLSEEEVMKIRTLRIRLSGTQIKTPNTCCVYSTFLLGTVFVFPFLFVCCNWWKKKAYKLTNVDHRAYDALADLLIKSKAQSLQLTIEDNFFNHAKAETLIEAFPKTEIQYFMLANQAEGLDIENENYSRFKQYMSPIRSTCIRVRLAWGKKIIS